jgi:thiol-disulfide isomerase/thioredoxin
MIVAGLLVSLAAGGCATAPPVGAAAPPFAGVDQEGEAVTLAAYRDRVLFLDFWSLWCGPCLRSGHLVEQLHQRYQDAADVEVLAVHAVDDGDPDAYLTKQGYTYRNIARGANIAAAYDINALPTYLVIDSDGRVAHRHFGELTESVRDELVEVIERIRPRSAPADQRSAGPPVR